MKAVHYCQKCHSPFVKDGGSNKISCICGATQCYICNAVDIKYDHFGDDKPCPLFSNEN